jgi:hypothetical protein
MRVVVFHRTRGAARCAARSSPAASVPLDKLPHIPVLRMITVGGGCSLATTFSTVSTQPSRHCGSNLRRSQALRGIRVGTGEARMRHKCARATTAHHRAARLDCARLDCLLCVALRKRSSDRGSKGAQWPMSGMLSARRLRKVKLTCPTGCPPTAGISRQKYRFSMDLLPTGRAYSR